MALASLLYSALGVGQYVLLLGVPQLLRPAWPALLRAVGHDEFIINVVGNFIVTLATLLCGNLLWLAVYRARSPFLESFRVSAKPWPWDDKPATAAAFHGHVLRGIWLTLLNVVLALPAGALNWGGVKKLGYSASAATFPSAATMAWQLCVFALVEDALFYWGHRALHHRLLYPWVHKLHHRFTHTVSISAVATHPVEYLLSNVLPAMAGPTLLGAHAVTVWTWLVWRLGETMANHSGYCLPWSMYKLIPFQGTAEEHDLHHSANTGNYGSLFTFWDTLCGTHIDPCGKGLLRPVPEKNLCKKDV